MKFSKNGLLIPQKVRYEIKHNELDEEMIENYLNNQCNFKVDYDNEANPVFIKNRKGGKGK